MKSQMCIVFSPNSDTQFKDFTSNYSQKFTNFSIHKSTDIFRDMYIWESGYY